MFGSLLPEDNIGAVKCVTRTCLMGCKIIVPCILLDDSDTPVTALDNVLL
jgi:hypothetical protein